MKITPRDLDRVYRAIPPVGGELLIYAPNHGVLPICFLFNDSYALGEAVTAQSTPIKIQHWMKMDGR